MRYLLYGFALVAIIAASLLTWAIHSPPQQKDPIRSCALAAKAMAACSAVGCIYTIWCCLTVSHHRLLARQVLNLALSQLAASATVIVAPLSRSACQVRDDIFFYLCFLSVLIELHMAVGTLLMVSRRQASLGCWSRWPVLLLWPITFVLYMAFYPWSVFKPELGFCIFDALHTDLQFVAGMLAASLLILLYLAIICVARRNSPSSVVAAHMRCFCGYLICSLGAYGPHGIYLLRSMFFRAGVMHKKEGLDRTAWCIAEVMLCSHGLLIAVFHVTHRMRAANRLGSCCRRREHQDEPPRVALSPRTSRRETLFDVAYVEHPDVVLIFGSSVARESSASQLDPCASL